MEYILVDAKAQGLPYGKILDITTPEVKTYGLDVIVTTGIVGQTHNGFKNLDLAFCPIEKIDTIDTLEVKLVTFATAYVAEKYPTT